MWSWPRANLWPSEQLRPSRSPMKTYHLSSQLRSVPLSRRLAQLTHVSNSPLATQSPYLFHSTVNSVPIPFQQSTQSLFHSNSQPSPYSIPTVSPVPIPFQQSTQSPFHSNSRPSPYPFQQSTQSLFHSNSQPSPYSIPTVNPVPIPSILRMR